MSAIIVMYVTQICPYCERAKSLLRQKGVAVKLVDVSNDPFLRQEMIDRSNGMKTVPQIFINGQHVGGSDDLYALDKKGELDKMLCLDKK